MQTDVNWFAQLGARDRLVVFVEQLTVNFQSGRKWPLWNASVETGLDNLEKCAQPAGWSRAFESKRACVFRKCRPLHHLRATGQADFAFVRVYFSNCQRWQILRDGVRIGFQRLHG